MRSKVATVLVASLIASSCADRGDISRTQVGAVVGAIKGSAVAASATHDKAKGESNGLDGGPGIGVVRMLNERDQQHLAQSTQQTLSTGAPQVWSNPETGVTVKTIVKSTTSQQNKVQIAVLKDKVQRVPPLDFIGEEYTATKAANVRDGPGTDYAVVGKLVAGQSMLVVGKVVNKSWYLVSENDVGSGFVSTELLQANPPPMTVPATRDGSIRSDASKVVQTTVDGSSMCRVVTQQVTTRDGRTATEDVRACRGPNGWQIISA